MRFSTAVRIATVSAMMTTALCVTPSSVWALEEPFGPKVFGVYSLGSSPENQDSSPTVQAGSHPFALTTSVVFNHTVTGVEENFKLTYKGFVEETEEEVPLGDPNVTAEIYGNPKNIEVNLPRGFVVNPDATPVKCTERQLETSPGSGGECPAASAVGVSIPSVSQLGDNLRSAVYNMVPPPGVPAELGVDPGAVGLVFHIRGRLRTGGDYGLVGDIPDVTQKVSAYAGKIVLWGEPSAESHDSERGVCATRIKPWKEIEEEFVKGGLPQFAEGRYDCPLASGERTGAQLLTMPGSCSGGALETTLSTESWQEPTNVIAPPMANTTAEAPAVTGCDKLHFKPSLDIRPVPEDGAAESPSGLNVDLKFPLQETEGLAEANLKKAVVTLPQGFAVSPSAANGLGACTPAQIGLHDASKPSCPDSSKLGEAEVTTPLLEHPLTGAVYLAQQETFEHSLIALYIVIEGQGALVKLGGTVALDPSTGQITATFDNNPQLPFSELKLRFFQGPRAPLVFPSTC